MDGSVLRIIAVPTLALLLWFAPFKVTQLTLMRMAFVFWLGGGLSLTIVGANRLSPLFDAGETTPLMIGIIAAIVIGLAKGKFVLSKTSKRNIERLSQISEPVKPVHVYSVKSWITIGIMLMISASLTWLQAPDFWRGIVNLAVGLALVMSSLSYAQAPALQNSNSSQA